MSIRYLKIILVIFVGLSGWLLLAGNIANWNAGLESVRYVMSMEGHDSYGTHIFPAVTNSATVVFAYLIILAGELLIGALSFKGAWDLFNARGESAEEFNSSKKYAILGAGMAMIVFFGGFVVIGGTLLQTWKTQVGSASFRDAFVFAASAGLVLLIVNQPDD